MATENISTYHESPLEKPVFPDTLSQEMFRDWIKMNQYSGNQMEANFVSREVFESYRGDFLAQPDLGVNKYVLYLPNDLKMGELIQFIDTLRDKLGLDYTIDNTPIQPFVEFLKVSIIQMRYLGYTKEQIQELQKKYNISDALIEKITHMQFSFGRIKSILRAYGEKINRILEYQYSFRSTDSISETEKQKAGITGITQDLALQLDTTIWHHGQKLIRYGFKDITQSYQHILRTRLQQETGWEKTNTGTIYPEIYKKGDEYIVIHSPDNQLETVDQLFRKSIDLESYKQRLIDARNGNNIQETEVIELEFTNLLISNLYKFPYQLLVGNHGYFPGGMLDTGEIYCVGYTLVGNAFLSELGIVHHGLDMTGHFSLSVNIGDKEYLFDAAIHDTLLEIKWENGKIVPVSWDPSENEKNRFMNTTKQSIDQVLLFSMYHNRSYAFLRSEKYNEALHYCDKAIKLNPQNVNLYIKRAFVLSQLGRYDEALADWNWTIKLEPANMQHYYNRGVLFNTLRNTKLESVSDYIVLQLGGTHFISYIPKIASDIEITIDSFLQKSPPDYEGLRIWFEGLIREEMQKSDKSK